jgi:hypothetical protein
VITGFNTDIEFGGVTYHVQTEDKGTTKSLILSLVYDRGTILASKRTTYQDLVDAGLDERVLAERLQKQHTLLCAAVRSGRIEDLKKMTQRESAKSKADKPAAVAGVSAISKPTESPVSVTAVSAPTLEIPIPKPVFGGGSTGTITFDEPILDAIELTDEDLIFPGDAVQIINEPSSKSTESATKLSIEILGESSFRGGDRRQVGFMVCRGNGRKVVREAQIMVKILGSSFKPLIYHARTDINGIAHVTVQLPNFNSGRAVFLVRAISKGEEIELRRPIAHG